MLVICIVWAVAVRFPNSLVDGATTVFVSD